MGTIANLEERDRRLALVRQAMQQADLAALLVAGKGHWWTGRGYLRYLTDFHLWGHDGLLLLPLEDDAVLTLTSHAVAARIGARGWVTDTRGDVFLVPAMVDAITEKGLQEATIGIAGLRWILPAGAYMALQEALPQVTFVDADELLDHVRMIRSPLEIQQARELWNLSKAAMERFVEILEPGRSQRELAAEASRLVLENGARDILVFIGEEPGDTNPPRDIPVRCDGILRYHMEICGESGHWSEITVTCAFRPPTDLELKLMDSELQAYERIRNLARPGVRLSEMARTFEQTLLENEWDLGPPTDHFDFHGQGMDTIERPWFAATPGAGSAQDMALKAGMVFSYHPRRAVLPSVPWGTGINEDILITEDGVSRLSGDWDLRWRVMT